MKYMLLIYGNQESWSRMTPADFSGLMAKHAALVAELTETSEFVDTNELMVENGKIVRTAGGVVEVTDGPFVEVKEVLAGYYLVECASLERATELAARLGEAEFGLVEVRQATRDPKH